MSLASERRLLSPLAVELSPWPWQRPLDTVGVLMGMAFALPALLYPHGNDQALHYYLGQGILLGELPYAHGISGKPPLIFVVHAIAIALFGPHQWAIRALEALALLLVTVWSARLFRRHGQAKDGDLGATALLVFGLHYSYFDYWDLSHPETFVALAALWGAHLSVFSPRPKAREFLCGVACGCAFMLKYTGGALAVPVAAYCGLRAVMDARHLGRAPILALLRAAGLYLAGLLLVILACIAPFYLGDAFGPMWEVLVTFTARYVDQAPGVAYTMQWTRPEAGGVALAASGGALSAGLLIALMRKRWADLGRGAYLATMLAAALLTVWMQKRFFSYHFTVASPLLAVGLYYGLGQALPGLRGLRMLAAFGFAGAALLSRPEFCTDAKYNYLSHVTQTDAYLRDRIARKEYLRPFVGMNYLDHYDIHEHIGLAAKARMRPGDQLCARGFATAIYQVSGMRCPSRHVMQAWPAGLPSWEPEWFADMKKYRPRFIVTFRDRPDELRRLHQLGYKRRHRMPALYLLLEHGK